MLEWKGQNYENPVKRNGRRLDTLRACRQVLRSKMVQKHPFGKGENHDYESDDQGNKFNEGRRKGKQ